MVTSNIHKQELDTIFQRNTINTDNLSIRYGNIFPPLPRDYRNLSSLAFEDLRISDQGEIEFVDGQQNTLEMARTPDGRILPIEQEIEWLLQFIIPLAERHEEFTIVHDNINYRGAQSQGQKNTWYHFRRVDPDTLPLGEFPTTDILYDYLKEVGIREGLVLVGGKTGSGKTSFISSYVATLTELYGGLTITIESPVEKGLEGKYQNGNIIGRIIQTQMAEEEFHLGIKAAMRKRPQRIYLGELRTTEAVHAAMNASQSGHLVLATMHGGSLGEVLLNLISRAAPSGNTDHYWKMLAESLQIVCFMDRKPGERKPQCQILPLCAQSSELGFRAKIRDGLIEGMDEDYKSMMLRLTKQQQQSFSPMGRNNRR